MTTFQRTVKYLAIALAAMIVLGIVAGAVSIIGSIVDLFTSNDTSNSQKAEYTFTADEISSVDIELGDAELTVKSGSEPKVEVFGKNISVKASKGELRIRQTGLIGFGRRSDTTIILTLPEKELSEFNIETGAGKLTLENVSARELDISLGAGDTTMSGVTVTQSADIEGGAGKLNIANSTIRSLHFEMGMGDVSINATLLGENQISCGIGDFDLKLMGGKDAYTLDIDKGIGKVSVDGSSVSGSSNISSGANKVDLECGIGKVNVSFE